VTNQTTGDFRRRAGRYPAATAVTVNASTAAATTITSRAFTPNNCVSVYRANSSAAGTPVANPAIRIHQAEQRGLCQAAPGETKS